MLAASSPSFAPREPTAQRIPVGVLVKTVRTDAGTMRVYRDPLGCSLTLRGVIVDRVDLATCSA
jgi:hypothetical protein